jgi:hypothetical protein
MSRITHFWAIEGFLALLADSKLPPRTQDIQTSENAIQPKFAEFGTGEVRGIHLLPGTRVHRGKKKRKGRGCSRPRPSAMDAAHFCALLAHREEPPVLLGEGVARQVLSSRGHNRLVDDPSP